MNKSNGERQNGDQVRVDVQNRTENRQEDTCGGKQGRGTVFYCNMPHCIKCTTICFKFIQKPIMRFYVPLVVNSKIMIFWDTIPCSSVGCFHISDRPLASTFSSVSCFFYPKMEE